MSRIGKMPVEVPKGVTVTMQGSKCVAKGPKGQLEYNIPERFKVIIEEGSVRIERPSDSKEDKAMHGLIRNLVRNLIVGVSAGFEKKLEIVGVGYKAAKQGAGVQINVGYSHPFFFKEDKDITFDVPNATTIVVKGIDKEKVGQTAANIRSIRPPEPYKGKGIKYEKEVIRRKVGKAGAK